MTHPKEQLTREQVETWREELLSDPKTIPSDDDRGKIDQLCDQALSALAPVSVPTEDMIVAGMEASVLGRPSIDDETYVLSIWNAMVAHQPPAPTVSQGEGGWMPIESAPKDGSWFLAVSKWGRIRMVRWADYEGDRYPINDEEKMWDTQPVAYMPLPTPPLEAKREGS